VWIYPPRRGRPVGSGKRSTRRPTSGVPSTTR